MAADCNYTANELAEQHRVLSLNKSMKKMQKVYPNDPCPCGSGKNYKKCCERKAGGMAMNYCAEEDNRGCLIDS